MSEIEEVKEVEEFAPSADDSVRAAIEQLEDASAEPSEPAKKEAAPESEDTSEEADLGSIPMPRSWARDSKGAQAWEKVPRAVQETIAHREYQRDVATQKKLQEVTEKGRYYETIERAVQPYAQELALQGFKPEQVVEQALALYKMASTDKAAAARWFLNELNLSPDQLAANQPQIDPNTRALYEKINTIESQLQARLEADKASQASAVDREVESFASEVDEKGQPLFPHVDALAEEMSPHIVMLMKQNPGVPIRTILKASYERAYWANPDMRASEIRRIEGQKQEAERARVEKARRAGSSVSGSPGGAIAAQAPSTVHDAVRQAFEQYGN